MKPLFDRRAAPADDTDPQGSLLPFDDPATVGRDVPAGEALSEALCQWMTPTWAAAELVKRHFGDLTERDFVLEPSCGKGAFLVALPEHVRAAGVEIDPALARIARKASGREVIVGDFRTAELPAGVSALIGNPPFPMEIVQGFFERAWSILPKDGRVGFILPVTIFQTASTVVKLSKRWGIQQELIPRNLFGRLQLPLCFALLTKGAGRSLVGFALYEETHDVKSLRSRYRAILASGERSVWAAVVRAALEVLGGEASVQGVYAEIQGHQPTENRFWQAKVRQTLQRIAKPCGTGRWRLPEMQACAA